MPDASLHPAQQRGVPLPAQLIVQYVGFQDARGRREYLLLAQLGERVRQYTMSIALEAFAQRRLLLQDGPDICYQMLVRALVDGGLVGTSRLSVSDEDLACYRDAHTTPARGLHGRRATC